MISTIINMFKIKELRQRLLFTVGLLAIYRIGCYVPAPGINPDMLSRFFGSGSGDLLNLMDLFTGGAMRQLTIFALGVMPYISASIIIQLMTSVVPALERLSREGEAGRRKINQYTRYGTILVCVIQAAMLSKALLSSEVNMIPAPYFNIILIITLTAGTTFLMWLGEQITSRGIGNGISLIITAGIVSKMPVAGRMMWNLYIMGGDESRPMYQAIILLIMFVAVVAGVIFVVQGQRRIPVQYAKRAVAGGKMMQGHSTYIPLRVNQAGVIPIIFASAVLMIPAAVGKIIPDRFEMLQNFFSMFSYGNAVYILANAVAIIFFCYFYTAITFNPVQIADDFKKGGAFIPGVRPGQATSEFLERVMVRITLPGSLFLAFIACVPMVISAWLSVPPLIASFLGGTGLLIVVGVMLDTMQQVEAHLLMRHYDGFMNKGRLRGRY